MNFPGLVLSLFMLSTQLASATTVLPVSLQSMTHSAEHIFHGKVILNEVKVDQVSQRVATFTTFNVIEAVKGKTGKTHTIKQIGGQLAGSQFIYVVHGIPKFVLGEEYVVFLPKKSRLGFSSPIGLGQGSYSVIKRDGIKTVDNQMASELLFVDQSSSKISSQTIDSLPNEAEHKDSRPGKKLNLAGFMESVQKISENN